MLEIPPLPRGFELSYYCAGPAADITRSVLAIVRVDQDAGILRDVRQAWAVDHFTGRVAPIAPAGVVCQDESWGVDARPAGTPRSRGRAGARRRISAAKASRAAPPAMRRRRCWQHSARHSM